MAFTRGTAQTVSTGSSTVSSIATTATSLAAGKLQIVMVDWETSSGTASCADTAGNTYTPLTKQQANGVNKWMQIFYCLSTTANASNVVTVTLPAGSQYASLVVAPYTPGGTASFVAEAGGAGTSATPSSASMTAGTLGVMVAGNWGGFTSTAGSGWTVVFEDGGTTGAWYGDRIDSPGGTIVGNTTMGASAEWGVAAATFTDAGGGGGGSDPLKRYDDGLPVAYYTDPGYAAIYIPHQLGITVANRSATGATVSAADGSIAIANTTTGVGAATQKSDGSVSVVTTLTGVGASRVTADASSTVVVTLTGVGQAVTRADGSITVTSSLTGIGASFASADASASAVFTLAGVGASSAKADGSSTAAFTLNGVGAATASADANSTTVITLNGVGASVAAGSADGFIGVLTTLTGIGAARASADASASAVFTLAGVGASQAPTVVSADGGITITGGLTGTGASRAGAAGQIVVQGGLTGNTQLTARRRSDGGKKRKPLIDVQADDDEILELAALLAPLLSGGGTWAH